MYIIHVAHTSSDACQPTPYRYHLDIFEELLSNYTDIADSLQLAPVIQGMKSNAPAYEFQGYGFYLINANISNAIRTSSCSSNEVTFFTGILFSDSDADGTLIELSYTNRAEAGVPVYAVQMDARADEIRLAYRLVKQYYVVCFGREGDGLGVRVFTRWLFLDEDHICSLYKILCLPRVLWPN